MPKSSFQWNTAVLEILCDYATEKIDAEEVHEKIDELAYYQNDVRSEVDAYYAGIA